MRFSPLIVLALMLVPGAPAAAQTDTTHDPSSPREALVTAVWLEGEIRIDGRLDEAAWDRAVVSSGFIQREPVEGIPAEQDARVRVLFDENALYIGAHLAEADPDQIADQLVRRGEEGQFDYFEVSLDPNLDRRTGYRFRVSAAGVQTDEFLYDDTDSDGAWNAVWESAVARTDDGWTVEMRIPLSQIRYQAGPDPQTWGINFSRRRLVTNEISDLALESRQRSGVVSQFGRLEGILLTTAASRASVRPYALARGTTVPPDERNPLRDAAEFGQQVGADLRYGLSGTFTLDATVNPDFGQVESDPAEINLTAFETFFREQRPFFVEDARVLDFSLAGRQNLLFYSRRIGREPSGRPPSGALWHRVPETSPIQAAAKLSGRTRGGLSVGALAASTGAVEGRAWSGDPGSEAAFVAEPAARYGVARLQQDLRGGESQFGGIVTGMYRDLPSDGAFDALTSSAYSVGLDFDHSWGDRTWGLSGHLAVSHVRGDSLALIRIQRSSNHYFQRPDAVRTQVDSSRTSLTGLEWRLQFERRSGRHWTGGVWFTQVTPGLEINDLGFARSQERLDVGGRIQYREIEPGRLFRQYRISAFTFHHISHEVLEDPSSREAWRDAYVFAGLVSSSSFTFHNNWGLDLNLSMSPTTMSRTATRGGPLMRNPGSVSSSLTLATDPRAPLALEPSLSVQRGAQGSGHEAGAGLLVTVRPASRLELEVEPRWDRTLDGAQYVATSRAVAPDETYGATYLFGELERSELSMVTRLNLTFTPTLTLQFFAQPLLSAGRVREYRILARARSYDLEGLGEGVPAGEGCSGGRTCLAPDGTRRFDLDGDGSTDLTLADRDFNVRSLVGNAVLRWEYRPGSTVFLVWQHQRREQVPVGDFRMGRDLDALAGLPGRNALILKVNYWLDL